MGEEAKKVKEVEETGDKAQIKDSSVKSCLGSDKAGSKAILDQYDETVGIVTDTSEFGSVVIDDGSKKGSETAIDKDVEKTSAKTGEEKIVVKDVNEPPVSSGGTPKAELNFSPPPLESGSQSSTKVENTISAPTAAQILRGEGDVKKPVVEEAPMSMNAEEIIAKAYAEEAARTKVNASVFKTGTVVDAGLPPASSETYFGIDGATTSIGPEPGLSGANGSGSLDRSSENKKPFEDPIKLSIDTGVNNPAAGGLDIGLPPLSGDGGTILGSQSSTGGTTGITSSTSTTTGASTDGTVVVKLDPVVERPVTADVLTVGANSGRTGKVNVSGVPIPQKEISTTTDKVELPKAETKVVYPVFDEKGRIVASQDSKGNVTKFGYDAEGKAAEIHGTAGDLKYNATTKTWEGKDKDGNALNISDVKFDNAGNVDLKLADGSRKELRADGSATLTAADSSKRELDKLGNTTKTVSATGETSTFKYNEKNEIIEVNSPMGAYKLNADGTWAGPRGDVSKIQVDPKDGSVLFDFKDGSVINRKMDGSRTEFDSDGVSIRGYNPKGQLAEMWSPNGDYSEFKYDAKGNRTEMTLWQGEHAGDSSGPVVFKAETPGGPLVDVKKKYKSVEVDSKTGDITYTHANDSKSIQHLDGRRDEIIGVEPNAVKTFSDADGNIVKVTSVTGESTTFKYENNKLVETTGPLGTFKQNADGSWEGPQGNVDKIRVTADGTLALTYKDGSRMERNPDGSRFEFSADSQSIRQYNAKGLLTTMWSANGDYSTFEYNANGERTSMTVWPGTEGGEWGDYSKRYVADKPGGPLYDAAKSAAVTIDSKTGDVTTIAVKVDEKTGEIIAVPGGRTEVQHIDGRRDVTIDTTPNATQTFSDKNGNIIKSINSDGGVSTFDYVDGKLTKATLAAPAGEWKVQPDGSFSNGKESINSLRGLENGGISYKDSKGLDTILDTAGNRTVYDKDSIKTFDKNNRLTEMLDETDKTSYKFHYDSNGLLDQVTNKSGTWTRVGDVDANGVASWVNPERPDFKWEGKNSTDGGNYTHTRVNLDHSEVKKDKDDRVVSVTNANGSEYKYNRDASGAVTGIEYSADGKTFTKLDTKGGKIEILDNGLAKITDAKGAVTTFAGDGHFTQVDSSGKRIAESDKKGNVYNFDQAGQITSIKTGNTLLERNADGSWQKSVIGADGVAKLDPKFSFNGQITFDSKTGQQQWASADGTYRKTVMPWGSTSESYIGADGKIAKQIDTNRTTRTETNFSGGVQINTVEKDAKTGRINSISDAGQPPLKTTLQYDAAGKLASITDAGGNKVLVNSTQNIKVDGSGTITVTDSAKNTQTVINASGKTIINMLDNSKDSYGATGVYLAHETGTRRPTPSTPVELPTGKPEARPEARPEPKPEPRPEPKPEAKPEPRPVPAETTQTTKPTSNTPVVERPATNTETKVTPVETRPTAENKPTTETKPVPGTTNTVPVESTKQTPVGEVKTGSAPIVVAENKTQPTADTKPSGPPPPPLSEKVISTDRPPVTTAPVVEKVANSAPVNVPVEKAPVVVAQQVEAPKVVVTQQVEAPKVVTAQPVEVPKVVVTQQVEAPKVVTAQPVEVPKVVVTQQVEAPKVVTAQPVEVPKVVVTQQVEAPKVVTTQPVEVPKVVVTQQPVEASKGTAAQPVEANKGGVALPVDASKTGASQVVDTSKAAQTAPVDKVAAPVTNLDRSATTAPVIAGDKIVVVAGSAVISTTGQGAQPKPTSSEVLPKASTETAPRPNIDAGKVNPVVEGSKPVTQPVEVRVVTGQPNSSSVSVVETGKTVEVKQTTIPVPGNVVVSTNTTQNRETTTGAPVEVLVKTAPPAGGTVSGSTSGPQAGTANTNSGAGANSTGSVTVTTGANTGANTGASATLNQQAAGSGNVSSVANTNAGTHAGTQLPGPTGSATVNNSTAASGSAGLPNNANGAGSNNATLNQQASGNASAGHVVSGNATGNTSTTGTTGTAGSAGAAAHAGNTAGANAGQTAQSSTHGATSQPNAGNTATNTGSNSGSNAGANAGPAGNTSTGNLSQQAAGAGTAGHVNTTTGTGSVVNSGNNAGSNTTAGASASNANASAGTANTSAGQTAQTGTHGSTQTSTGTANANAGQTAQTGTHGTTQTNAGTGSAAGSASTANTGVAGNTSAGNLSQQAAGAGSAGHATTNAGGTIGATNATSNSSTNQVHTGSGTAANTGATNPSAGTANTSAGNAGANGSANTNAGQSAQSGTHGTTTQTTAGSNATTAGNTATNTAAGTTGSATSGNLSQQAAGSGTAGHSGTNAAGTNTGANAGSNNSGVTNSGAAGTAANTSHTGANNSSGTTTAGANVVSGQSAQPGSHGITGSQTAATSGNAAGNVAGNAAGNVSGTAAGASTHASGTAGGTTNTTGNLSQQAAGTGAAGHSGVNTGGTVNAGVNAGSAATGTTAGHASSNTASGTATGANAGASQPTQTGTHGTTVSQTAATSVNAAGNVSGNAAGAPTHSSGTAGGTANTTGNLSQQAAGTGSAGHSGVNTGGAANSSGTSNTGGSQLTQTGTHGTSGSQTAATSGNTPGAPTHSSGTVGGSTNTTGNLSQQAAGTGTGGHSGVNTGSAANSSGTANTGATAGNAATGTSAGHAISNTASGTATGANAGVGQPTQTGTHGTTPSQNAGTTPGNTAGNTTTTASPAGSATTAHSGTTGSVPTGNLSQQAAGTGSTAHTGTNTGGTANVGNNSVVTGTGTAAASGHTGASNTSGTTNAAATSSVTNAGVGQTSTHGTSGPQPTSSVSTGTINSTGNTAGTASNTGNASTAHVGAAGSSATGNLSQQAATTCTAGHTSANASGANTAGSAINSTTSGNASAGLNTGHVGTTTSSGTTNTNANAGVNAGPNTSAGTHVTSSTQPAGNPVTGIGHATGNLAGASSTAGVGGATTPAAHAGTAGAASGNLSQQATGSAGNTASGNLSQQTTGVSTAGQNTATTAPSTGSNNSAVSGSAGAHTANVPGTSGTSVNAATTANTAAPANAGATGNAGVAHNSGAVSSPGAVNAPGANNTTAAHSAPSAGTNTAPAAGHSAAGSATSSQTGSAVGHTTTTGNTAANTNSGAVPAAPHSGVPAATNVTGSQHPDLIDITPVVIDFSNNNYVPSNAFEVERVREAAFRDTEIVRQEEARRQEEIRRQEEEARRIAEIARQEEAARYLQETLRQDQVRRDQESQRIRHSEIVRAESEAQTTQPVSTNLPAYESIDAASHSPNVGHNLAESPFSMPNHSERHIEIASVDAGLPSRPHVENTDSSSDWLSDAAGKYGYGSQVPTPLQTDFGTVTPTQVPNNIQALPVENTQTASDTSLQQPVGQNSTVQNPVPANIESPPATPEIENNAQVNSDVVPGPVAPVFPETIQTNFDQPAIQIPAVNINGQAPADSVNNQIAPPSANVEYIQSVHTHSQKLDPTIYNQMPDWLQQATSNLGLQSPGLSTSQPDHKAAHDHNESHHRVEAKQHHEVKPATAAEVAATTPTDNIAYTSNRVDTDNYTNSVVAGDSSAPRLDYSTIDNDKLNNGTSGADYGIMAAADQASKADQDLANQQIEEQTRALRSSEDERLALAEQERVTRDNNLKLQQEEAEKRRRDEEEDRRENERKHEDKRRSDEILTILALRQQAEAEAKAKSQRLSEERQKAQEAIRKDNQQEKYVVRQGDTLVSIARIKLRDPRLTDLIYEMNKNRVEVRWTDGRRTYSVEVGTILTLPSPKQVREWTARLNNVSSRTSHQGLDAKSSAKADERRANIEKVLGKIREAADGGDEKTYSVRLGDTLRSIAMKHPDLHDVTLWTLLADKNGLTTETDSKGAPLAVVIRGTNLVIPTHEEIEIFRNGTASFKPVAREPQQFTGSYGSLFDVATKACGGCRRLISDSANLCPACGYVFEMKGDASIESQATTFNIPDGDTTLSLPEHTIIVDNYGEQTTVVDIDKATMPLPKANGNGGSSGANGSSNTGNTNVPAKASGTTGDGRPSTNLSHRSLDERSNAIEVSRDIESLNPSCRLVKTERELDGERFFCQQLQVLIDEDWTPVLSYEVGHESSVRHEYSRDGRKKTIKIDLPSGAVGEMVTNELTANWLDYCQRYLAGRKLSA